MNRNNKNPMINDGSWAKVGDKTYRHESGIIIRYNCNDRPLAHMADEALARLRAGQGQMARMAKREQHRRAGR